MTLTHVMKTIGIEALFFFIKIVKIAEEITDELGLQSMDQCELFITPNIIYHEHN